VNPGRFSDGAIVVYSNYEKRVLGELAAAFPNSAPDIEAIMDRLVDLERIVRAHVAHPEFRGRTSLKKVVPALVDDVTYDDLEVQNGLVASHRYEQAILGDVPKEERKKVCDELRAYCETDTLAELRLFQELRRVCQ